MLQRLSGFEMFGELEALRLIVRADALAVEFLRQRHHLLIDEAADDLAVLEDEGHFARAHFEHRAGALPAGPGIAEAGVEEARIMHAKFTDQRIERHHLGGVGRRHLHGFLGGEDVELARIEDQAFVRSRADRLPEFPDRITRAPIDVEKRDGHSVADFWEPIAARADKSLILDPDEFYILASKEAVQVPPDYAAEMVPFDPLVGEFRVHYAGFFDPGFGYAGAGGQGSRAVLEVRSREVPFILEHGQIVGRLVYEKMLARPSTLYGMGIGSNYQAQGLKLSKHFRV